MIKVIPTYSYSKSWFHFGETWTKGYAFTETGKLLEGEVLAEFLSKVESVEMLAAEAAKLNGLFCAMGTTSFGDFAIVDRIRSIPLFYTLHKGKHVVSDSPYSAATSAEKDMLAENEFLSAGYCLKSSTLLKDVKQVEAGSFVIFESDQAKPNDYFVYATGLERNASFSSFKVELKSLLDNAMERLLKSINGRHIAIPLSGGYDSRFILVWLVANNYNNITAFTYGREGNPEMLLAKKVAEKLNIKWIPVVYSKEMMADIVKDDFFSEYIPFASTACSMPFFQDYPAMKYLKTSNSIPDDSVVVSGHSGDFLAGSHLLPEHKNISNSKLKSYVLHRHHNLLPVEDDKKKLIEQQIQYFISNYYPNLAYTMLEWWDLRERQAKFIVNATRTYHYFGYDVRLPLFDKELMDFFKFVPFQHKLAKNLYNYVLEDSYFKPTGIIFKDELQATLLQIRVQQIKEKLKYVFPAIGKLSKKPYDNNCYREIAESLYGETKITRSLSLKNFQTNAPIAEWYLKYFDVKIEEWILRENK